MKKLADQVREYMKGREWNARQMADHVAKFEGGEKVKRQHIEQLMENGVQNPRYLKALAAAMETSIDDLMAGRYVYPAPGEKAQIPAELTKTLTNTESQGEPGELLLRLAAILGPLSQWGQDSALKLIAEAVKTPALAPAHAMRLEGVLKLEAAAPTVTSTRTADQSIKDALARHLQIDNTDESHPATEQRKEK